jgi:hypothetical protein
MAHGLGAGVADAATLVRFPRTGTWRVWVRTMDWVASLEGSRSAGKVSTATFERVPHKTTFGDSGSQWHWQDAELLKSAGGDTLALAT